MNCFKHCLLLTAASFIQQQLTFAQIEQDRCPLESETLSLNRALDIALEKSPMFKAAELEVKAARGYEEQSGLWDNPQIFLEAEEWPVERSFEESRYLLGFSQTIPFPGKKRLERLLSEQARSATEYSNQARRTNLVRRIRIAFYRTLSSRELLAISSQLREVAEDNVATAAGRLEAGASTPQEVLRAEIQLERVKNEQAQYQRGYSVSRSKLATHLGMPELINCTLTGSLQQSAPAHLAQHPKAAWLAVHPLILAAEAKLVQAGIAQERSELSPYPDLSVSIAGGHREIDNDILLDLGVSIPLPIINRSRGEQSAARALKEKAQADLLQMKQSLLAQLEQSITALSKLNEQVNNYRKEILPRSKRALSLVQTGFKEGEFGVNDLLDIQRTLAEARLLYQLKIFEMNRVIADVESLLTPAAVFNQ